MSMTLPLSGSMPASDSTDAFAALSLDATGKKVIVETKATCPFIGGAITDGALAVRNTAARPMASLEDIRRLGNTGGGDLGDLMALFAAGNHTHLHDDANAIGDTAPPGLFFLDFPGSQGSRSGQSRQALDGGSKCPDP